MLGFACRIARASDLSGAGWLHGLKLAAVAVVAQAVWGMRKKLCADRARISLCIGAAVLLAPSGAVAQLGVIAFGGLVGWRLYRDTIAVGAVPGTTTWARAHVAAANPLVVEALAQVGLSLPSTAPQPPVFDLFKAGRHFHYVIGVCDEEHGQKCPLFPGVTQRLYWSFPDPASFEGTHDERLTRVIEVRDAIRTRLDAWPSMRSGPARSSTTRTDSQ